MNHRRLPAAALAGLASLAAPACFAAEGTPAPLDSGHTAWVLTASALVLFMTLPGLAMFYGGLVRARNLLSVLMHSFAICCVVSLIWAIFGYSVAFDGNAPWLGGLGKMFLAHLDHNRTATGLPENVFALFQMTFAIITPTLIIGAFPERVKFSFVVMFSALWLILVYLPAAHLIWGGGWMAQKGVLDFAGGIVVHTTAGVSALVTAMLLGKRNGFPRTLMLPHSPALTMAGAALLWVGWFGFNGGSALAANDDAAAAIINTHAAACAAALMWLAIERFSVGKPTSIGFATGAIAGLATVTPAAGFISPGAAVLFGVVAASACYPMIQLVKFKLQIDDSLDVFAVHGVGGMIGSLLLAVFLAPELGGTGYAEGMTMASQLAAQGIGVIGVAVFSAVASALLAIGVNLVQPMRVSEDEEREGLDLASHGERAWEMD